MSLYIDNTEPIRTPAIIATINDNILAQITALESQALESRGSRELNMSTILAQNPTKTEKDLLDPVAGDPYYRKLKATNDQIAALRARLIK